MGTRTLRISTALLPELIIAALQPFTVHHDRTLPWDTKLVEARFNESDRTYDVTLQSDAWDGDCGLRVTVSRNCVGKDLPDFGFDVEDDR